VAERVATVSSIESVLQIGSVEGSGFPESQHCGDCPVSLFRNICFLNRASVTEKLAQGSVSALKFREVLFEVARRPV
jgi:hypothetical protein